MRYYSLLQFLFLSSLARARSTQFPLVNQSNICPASVIDGANATGTGTFDAWELVFDQYYHGSTNLSWAMTVDEGFQTGDNNVSFPTIDTSLWIGQPPGIDLYDGANGFSACAFQFGNLPLNTIERGQDDDGSCYQTFSPACVTALTDQVARFAQWQTSSYTGGPYSNLTPPILGYVCGNIQAAIGSYSGNGPVEHAFPAECQPYFQHGSDPSPNTDAFELSYNTTDDLSTPCWVANTSTLLPNTLLRQATTFYVDRSGHDTAADAALYDNATRAVVPVLSVFMPQANNSRQQTISNAWAAMTCLRASKFAKGTRVPPALPAPTPVKFPHPLSKGTKAGIAVAVIVGVGLLAIVAGWVYLTKQRRKASSGAVKLLDGDKDGKGWDGAAAQLGGSEKYEVVGDQKFGHEVDGGGGGMSRAEAAGTPVAVGKAGTARGPPEELEGQAHHRMGSPVEMQG